LKEVADLAAARLARASRTDDDKLAAVSAAADEFEREAVTQRLLANRPPPPQLAPAQPSRARNLLLAGAAGAFATVALVAAIFVLFVMGQLPVPGFWHGQGSHHSARTAAVGEPTPTPQSTPATPRLVVTDPTGLRGEPVPLGLTLLGRSDEAVIVLTGLPPGMTLSAGRAAGAQSWQIAATDLANTWIGPPPEFVGAVVVTAELRLADTKIADRQAIHVEWRVPPERDAMVASAEPLVATKAPAEDRSERSIALPLSSAPPVEGPPAQRQLDREEIAVLVRRGQEFLRNGDIPAARLVLQRAAETRDAEAALMLATTYDPVVLRELKVVGFAADVAMAWAWYEKARDFGSATAAQRLEILANAAR